MIARAIGVGIVCAPFISALLLGCGRGGRALTRHARTDWSNLMLRLRRKTKPAPTAPAEPVEPAAPAREPNTHDYRPSHLAWGRNIVIHRATDNGLRVSGWGYNIEQGDHLLIRYDDADARFEVAHIQYHPDPRDMWAADLVRTDGGEQR